MDLYYLKVPERLKECRERQKLTQEQMGRLFGVTQSHYAKLESGTKIISYASLEMYEKSGGDSYYLLTGKERRAGKLDEYMNRCEGDLAKKIFFELAVSIIKCGAMLCAFSDHFISDLTYKSMRLAESKSTSIWEKIRDAERMSQLKIAELLDINIKRYRRIEKGDVEPDAEILCTLYHKLHYSPMIFLNQEIFYLDELNQIWDQFPVNMQRMLVRVMEYIVVMYKEYGDGNTDEKSLDCGG